MHLTPEQIDILHLMPGHTRRVGQAWNPRQANIECVAVGQIVQGPEYPELRCRQGQPPVTRTESH